MDKKKPKHGMFQGNCFENCIYRTHDNQCSNDNRLVNIVGMCLSWEEPHNTINNGTTNK